MTSPDWGPAEGTQPTKHTCSFGILGGCSASGATFPKSLTWLAMPVFWALRRARGRALFCRTP
eukprot:7824980-Alexandrium_andersonii.AAC.1